MRLIPTTGDQQGVMLIVVSAIFLALAILAVALRLWSLCLKKRSLAANDYLIIIALMFSTGLVAVNVTAVIAGGLGQHTVDLITQPHKLIVFGKSFVAVQPLWVSAITSVKISILRLYINIFRSRIFRNICFVAIAVCGLFFVFDILAAFLICRPLAFNWDITIPGGHCGNKVAVYIAAHTINFVVDVSLAILPMPILWGLQMSMRKKIELSIMFSLGTLICIISLLRIAYWRKVLGADLTYSATLLYLFTALEPLLGIFLASLPFMRPAGIVIINSSMFSWTKILLRSGRGSGYGKEPLDSKPVIKNSKVRHFRGIHNDPSLSTAHIDVEDHSMENLRVADEQH
ncbi:hypothetical protein MMC22_004007 [Lobaria immixta]|nr:hypothetical protein [Lobaria immixta]